MNEARMFRAQLIRVYEGEEESNPEFEGRIVVVQVGIPKGRLQLTRPSTGYLYLRLFTDPVFEPDMIASPVNEIARGRRDVIVPGHEPNGTRVDWHLHLDHHSVEEYEAFLERLKEQGCRIARPLAM